MRHKAEETLAYLAWELLDAAMDLNGKERNLGQARKSAIDSLESIEQRCSVLRHTLQTGGGCRSPWSNKDKSQGQSVGGP